MLDVHLPGRSRAVSTPSPFAPSSTRLRESVRTATGPNRCTGPLRPGAMWSGQSVCGRSQRLTRWGCQGFGDGPHSFGRILFLLGERAAEPRHGKA